MNAAGVTDNKGKEAAIFGQPLLATGYGAWSTGNITDETVQEYLEHHRNPSNQAA